MILYMEKINNRDRLTKEEKEEILKRIDDNLAYIKKYLNESKIRNNPKYERR